MVVDLFLQFFDLLLEVFDLFGLFAESPIEALEDSRQVVMDVRMAFGEQLERAPIAAVYV
jgi:hypothetical protein